MLDKKNNDIYLINKSLNGDAKSLNLLIENYQSYIYNIVWKMVLNPQDAEDITQDILIKIITNLSNFRQESSFSTWVYRIAFNHILNIKKRPMEEAISTFEEYGNSLDRLPNTTFIKEKNPNPEEKLIIKDVMLGCTAGMLLCLDRQQRLIYIIGEIFELDSKTASEILNIKAGNFRQQLSRAKKNLYSFMQNKCGLINKNNPCRCQKKTKSFINEGWVDPKNLKFNASYIKKINQMTFNNCEEIDNLLEKKYAQIFKEHPFQERNFIKEKINKVLKTENFKHLFDLN